MISIKLLILLIKPNKLVGHKISRNCREKVYWFISIHVKRRKCCTLIVVSNKTIQRYRLK